MFAMRLFFWTCCLSIASFAVAQVDCDTADEGTLCNVELGCGCYDINDDNTLVCSRVPDQVGTSSSWEWAVCGTPYSTPACSAWDAACVTTVAVNGICAPPGLHGGCQSFSAGWVCVDPYRNSIRGMDCSAAGDGSCECKYGECFDDNDNLCPDELVVTSDPGVVGDPHMQGIRDQNIDWHGVDSGWYSLIKDDVANLNINARLTAPLPDEFPDRQLITSLAVMSEGHSLVVEVANPYTTDTDGCPEGVSPCLANGGLRVFVDGQETDGLLQFCRGVQLADGGAISVSASNLPVECRQFGGDKIWARMYQEMLEGTRDLESGESLEEWILSSGHMMAAPEWCTKYIAENSLVVLQSTHAIFKIETPNVTVRLNVGVNFQGEGELDWDGRVLPDLEFWQMDVGVEGLDVENPALSGLLGETARPVYDENGNEVMTGSEAFRGTVEDYRVSNARGFHFALLDKKEEGHHA